MKNKLKTVNQLPNDFIFLSDSQDVATIHRDFPEDSNGYDSFFVRVSDGALEIYGMTGLIPYLSKLVYRIER